MAHELHFANGKWRRRMLASRFASQAKAGDRGSFDFSPDPNLFFRAGGKIIPAHANLN
jgi:hypothetical protein